MIQYVPIREFQPDAPRYGSEALDHVENLVPSFGGYRSARQKSTRTFNLAPSSDRAINGAIAHIYLEETAEQKERPSGVSGTPDFFRSNSEHTQDDLEDLVGGLNPSDTSYIVAGGGETGQIELLIPDFETPASTPGWVIRLRWRIDDHQTGTYSISYTLKDGGTTLRGPITVDSSTDASSGGWATYEDTFTGNLSWGLDDLRIVIDTVVDGPDADFQPEADVSNASGWKNSAGTTANLYSYIDEDSQDDADFIHSPVVTAVSTNPKCRLLMEDVDENFAFYADGFSPAPFVPRFRVRSWHDNVVPQYSIYDKDGNVLREGDIDVGSSTSFSTNSRSVDSGDVTKYDGIEIELGCSISSIWLNAEENNGGVAADEFVDTYPTSWQVGEINSSTLVLSSSNYDESDFSGDYEDLDDQGDANEVVFPLAQPAFSGGVISPRAELVFDDFDYPGINAGWTLSYRLRRASSGNSTYTIEVLDGIEGTVIATKTSATSSGSYTTDTLDLSTTAIMSSIEAASAFVVRVYCSTINESIAVDSVWLNYPRPAWAEVSQLEIRTRPNSRASVSWVEMQVPSSSTGYIDDRVELYGGDESDLYLVEDTGFTSLGGTTYGNGTSLARPWSFAQWGNDVIATNNVDPVQVRSDGAGNFADLITSTNKPKARFVTGVRNQVFLGHCEGDGGTVDMVWWSGIDDASDFDPSLTTQSDFQRLRDTPGQITGLVGGQYATIFKRHSIYRADYVGLPVIYEFRMVSEGVGTPYPRSIVQVGEDIYFYTGSGFAVLRGGSSVSLIGDESVSRFVADIDFSPYALRVQEESQDVFEDLAMFGAYDPNSRLIFWFYSGPNGFMFEDDTSPADIRNVVYNDALTYDTRTGRWGYMNFLRGKAQEEEAVNATASVNVFKPEISHTSWTRGMGVFGWDNGTDHGGSSGMAQTYLQLADESVFPSEILTKVFTVEDGKDVTINRIRPVFTAVPEGSANPDVTVTLLSGQDPLMLEVSREVVFAEQDSDKWYLGRNSGEFFQLRLEFEPSNNEFVREIQGFQIDFEVTGERGG